MLGQGQLSLAKYLLIVAGEDYPELDVRNVPDFFRHVLERVDWRRDLHFQTCTTIDTLDYSGDGLNQGSKVVVAAAGPGCGPCRWPSTAASRLPEDLGFRRPMVFLPGILVVEGPAWKAAERGAGSRSGRRALLPAFNRHDAINNFPLVVVVDQSEFAARNLDNFLWTTFTRSNPATDIYGIEAFIRDKHWGCFGSLVIDARTKPHHAPPLIEDPVVTQRVDALAAPEGRCTGLFESASAGQVCCRVGPASLSDAPARPTNFRDSRSRQFHRPGRLYHATLRADKHAAGGGAKPPGLRRFQSAGTCKEHVHSGGDLGPFPTKLFEAPVGAQHGQASLVLSGPVCGLG